MRSKKQKKKADKAILEYIKKNIDNIIRLNTITRYVNKNYKLHLTEQQVASRIPHAISRQGMLIFKRHNCDNQQYIFKEPCKKQ